MRRLLDRQDLLAGLLFVAVGAASWSLARNYAPGTAFRMGPGYVPVGLSFILMALGVLVALRSAFAGAQSTGEWKPRGLVFVLASVLAFALLIETGGMVAAIVGTTVIASFASRESRPVEVALAAALLALAGGLIFVVALGLPIPLWPRFGA
ncbi:MAG: tripartite tricarboxylate transporter TctB family protein [Alphaproteobacteria bacterium]|nr:tripartite tricarboxylate transporter TctB family protein [Alphaproteobacteria bacterium]